jgi:hypothetical protein
MLAVSASRHGLLLAFWLKATLYVDFFATFGAPVDAGMLAGAVELPGSGALASAQAVEWVVRLAWALALATAISSTISAAPTIGAILLRCIWCPPPCCCVAGMRGASGRSRLEAGRPSRAALAGSSLPARSSRIGYQHDPTVSKVL